MEHKQIKIFIVTVCLNARNDLAKTVDSVLCQSYSNWQLIIKDGGSTDGSIESIGKDERILIIQEKDSGIYNAMNQAFEHIDRGYICFLNAGDCLLNKDVLECVAEFIASNDADVYYGDYQNALKAECVLPPVLKLDYMYRSFLCHQSVFYKNTIMIYYDEEFSLLADHDLHLKLIKSGKRFVHMPITVCFYQGGGVSENPKFRDVYEQEREIIRNKYFSSREWRLFRFKELLMFPHLRTYISGTKSPRWLQAIYRDVVTAIRRR
jgi:glycosyltransferase involved in cell wall biosynthesis